MTVRAPAIRTDIVANDRMTRVMRRLPFAALSQRLRFLRGEFDRLRRSAVMTRMINGFRTLGTSLASMGRQLRGLIGPWTALFGIGAAGGLAALTMRFASHGDAVAKTARELGLATDRYQELMFAAGQSGVSTNEFATSIRGLFQALRQAQASPTGEQAEAFREMGVEIEDAEGNLRALDEILFDIMPIFEELRRQGRATDAGVLSSVLFGARGGQAFLNFLSLSQSDLQDLFRTGRDVGAIIPEEELTRAERMTDIIGMLEAAGRSVTSAIGAIMTEQFGDDLERFSRWLVDNREQIAEWTRDVVVSIGRVGNELADFLFGPQQYNMADSPLGRMGGFVDRMMGVLTPIADGIQGIVNLIGGWENALLVILALFAGKLLLAVLGLAGGIAQIGIAIGAMVLTALPKLGRLITRFGALTRAARAATTVMGVASGGAAAGAARAGAGAGTASAGAGGGLSAVVNTPAVQSIVGAASRLSGPALAAMIMLNPRTANESDRTFLRDQVRAGDEADLQVLRDHGASEELLDILDTLPPSVAQASADLIRSSDTFEGTVQSLLDGARSNADAAEDLRRAAENPPHGEIDLRITIDQEGRVRAGTVIRGEGVGDVTVNDGPDNADWALPRP